MSMQLGWIVDALDENGVTVKNKAGEHRRINSKTVIWAAGVAVSQFARKLTERTASETDRAGHLKVDNHLTVLNYPEIFVIGDLAFYLDKKGKPLPGVAQVAMQEGAYAAKVITRRVTGDPDIQPFSYFDKGDLAVLGRAKAVANVFGVHLSGFPAWVVWLFIHLLYIVEFQSRLLVALQWGFLYLTYNRGARLITGSTSLEQAAPSAAPVRKEASAAPART